MGEVVARVAHEMRNPLFGITAAAQILAMEVQLNPSQKELMDSLFQEAKRMNNLVEELLDCSKEIKLNKKPVDIIKIMNETIGFNEVFLLEKHLTVEKNFPSEIVYNADPERLKQVFLNLFKNSIDASPPGGSINFSLHQDDSNITVSICDAGMGIPENIMEKILDVFFTTKKSGTGLGLYICKKIVDAHGGTLSFANNEPSGVTFSVSLPLE
jgi:signal transduction histidine kinase